MFSDDGGVDSTMSSSRTLRARSRRGTLAGAAGVAALRAAGRRALLGFRFAAARFAPSFRAPVRALGRLADRALAPVFFRVARRELAVRLALRLAIVECPFE